MSVSSELNKLWKLASDPEFRAMKRQVKAFRAAHGRGTPERYEGLSPGDVVLDVGCASGEITMDLAAHCGRIHGIDLGGRLIEIARAEATRRGIANETFELRVVDAAALSALYDRSFHQFIHFDVGRAEFEKSVGQADALGPVRLDVPLESSQLVVG